MSLSSFVDGGKPTQRDWAEAVNVVRGAVPKWARRHSEFESEANVCLAQAIVDFDPERGVPFGAYLTMKAKSLVARELARFDGVPRSSRRPAPKFESLEVLSPARHPVSDSMEERIVEKLAVQSMLSGLPASRLGVVREFAAGWRGVEVAERLGVTESAVSQHKAVLRARLSGVLDVTIDSQAAVAA